MATQWTAKDPAEVDDFGINFAPRLKAGETITTGPDWTVPAPLIVTLPGFAGAVAVARFAGGVNGKDYRCACQVGTSLGRILKRTRTLSVRTL